MNSVVKPIFNEKVAEKWNLWIHEQYTNALFTEDLVKYCSRIKKKKKKRRQNAKEETHRSFQHNSNGYIMCALLRNFLHRANT